MVDNARKMGIDSGRVTQWFCSHVPDAKVPLVIELIAGGKSNLTFTVTDSAGRRWVLRRPPLGHVLATAHDMSREFNVISALKSSEVPVATAVGLCTDTDVTGAPFYVMEYVEGHVLRDRTAACRILTEDSRRAAGFQAIDVLSQIHDIEIDAVGLGSLGRREGYIERQLGRWHKQWERSRSRELPLLESVHRRLSDLVPTQGRPAIVHGDYRIDNCIVSPTGSISAVLDWELCTLGDPLADLGLLLVYWSEPDEPDRFAFPNVTKAPGFPTREEVVERYAKKSGRDVTNVDYYSAFACWRLACIVEGISARYRGGAMGPPPADLSRYAENVEYLVNRADGQLENLL